MTHSSAQGITAALYFSTKAAHHEAETTGVIRHLLRGDASRDGYVMLMRNVLPAYRALENGLARHRDSPMLAELAAFAFDRAGAIEADLAALAGSDFATRIVLLPAGEAYAARIEEVSQGDGARLIAHAYTRYLGDLSGGQILRRLLTKSLDLQDDELSFYDFPRFADLAVLKSDYRSAIDRAARSADPDAIVAEGTTAFRLNIDVSCAVDAYLAGRAAAE